MSGDLVLDDVEVDGRPNRAVLVSGGLIRAVGEAGRLAPPIPEPPEPGGRVDPSPPLRVVDGGGAALLPGLHDHHVHLFALAMRTASVWCGAPAVDGPAALAERLRTAAAAGPWADPGGWVRGVGWDDEVAGWPDRADLDAAVPDRPVRLQHRSGDLWVLNGAALDRAGLDRPAPGAGRDGWPAGVELGPDDRPTGRIWGLDGWLRDRVGGGPPSLAEVSAALAAVGVTGVTDAGAHNGPAEVAALDASRRAGDLVQSATAMTSGPGEAPVTDPRGDTPDASPPGQGPGPGPVGVALGPVKLVIAERVLPSPGELAGRIAAAHHAGRVVAVHAASRVAVVLALAAFADAGAVPGDRLEHAAVVDPGALGEIARLGLTVVTQPHFVRENGDRYLAGVDPADRPWLYRGRGFLDAGVPLAAGSDAPVGGLDPWAAMAAAVDRRAASGAVIGTDEELSPEQALALFTGHPRDPGGPSRRIAPGEVADLCLIDRPWSAARRAPDDVRVRTTIAAGRVIFDARG